MAAPAMARSRGARTRGRGTVRARARNDGHAHAHAPPHQSRREALVALGLVLPASVGVAGPSLAAVLDATPAPGAVLVAGATGLTGRRVVAELRRRGFEARAGARDLKKAESLGLPETGAEVVLLDVLDAAQVAQAMQGAAAVVCATGFTPSLNLGKDNPAKVDRQGTVALVDAAVKSGTVKKFVLVSSLLTNARAIGQQDNPNYKFLNAFGNILEEKLQAEKYLRASGLDYTIVRPGGLSDEPASAVGNIIVRGEDTLFGLDDDPGRAISRDTVAEVCVEALIQPGASNRVVEVVASPTAPPLGAKDWFASL